MTRALRYCGCLIVSILALAALGALVPTLPVVGSLGPLLVSPLGSWIVIAALLLAIAYAIH